MYVFSVVKLYKITTIQFISKLITHKPRIHEM